MANIRTQRTKAAIREALLSCTKEKPAGDISVAEVCRSAGIDRTTFYRHYKDIDDVLQEMGQEQLVRFRELLEQSESITEMLVNGILDMLEQTKSLYRVYGDDSVSDMFKSDVIATAKKYGYPAWRKNFASDDDIKAELVFEAFLAGALQIALSADGKVDRETTVKMIMGLADKSYERRSDS